MCLFIITPRWSLGESVLSVFSTVGSVRLNLGSWGGVGECFHQGSQEELH